MKSARPETLKVTFRHTIMLSVEKFRSTIERMRSN